jgi:hypothetical protein
MMDAVTPEELRKLTASLEAEKQKRELRVRAATDFKEFAENFLHIRTKAGVIRPLLFNKAQRVIHEALEKQRAETGKVRALILKARQMGCSTYIGGRLYHRVINGRGLRCFIMAHEGQATQNLFEMVSRFHGNMPADIKLEASTENAKELAFAAVDGAYKIATARTTGVGRSSTLQLLHGSEVAFWQHAETHAAGVMQAVANEPGTEIILESTANGVGGWFHTKWREAESGDSEFIPIFVPWNFDPAYRIAVDELRLTPEEEEYQKTYGLDLAQMAFRRNKISELGDELLFRQEYPITAAEAFQLTGHDAFIAPSLVTRARKSNHEASGPLVVSFDPSWLGGDRAAMAWRRGRRVIKVEVRKGLDTMAAAGWCRKVIAEDKPAKLFLDVGGVGAGVSDRLQEMGLGGKIEAVNFGSSPIEPPPLDDNGKPFGGPANRRAEMWLNMKKWLESAEGVMIPDKDEVQADVCGPSYKYDSNTRLLLEKKEDMRRRGVPSPDIGDAIALTFARPIKPPPPRLEPIRPHVGSWMSM